MLEESKAKAALAAAKALMPQMHPTGAVEDVSGSKVRVYSTQGQIVDIYLVPLIGQTWDVLGVTTYNELGVSVTHIFADNHPMHSFNPGS